MQTSLHLCVNWCEFDFYPFHRNSLAIRTETLLHSAEMKTAHPSPLELQVLSVLWEHGDCTVRTVLENLPDGRDRAYTTALSVLQTMERKGRLTES